MTITESGQRAVRLPWLSLVAAAALAIPVALPAVFGYDTNPAFLLAPLVIWSIFSDLDALVILFGASILCGLISVAVSARLHPDGRFLTDILSLALLTFTASFYFLGRKIPDFKQLVHWLCVFSAVFVIGATVNLLVAGEPVRLLVGDFEYMNLRILGWPAFASFGVNALTHLVCIQAALLCGAIISRRIKPPYLALFSIALACAAFLIVGSNARSALLFLVLLVASIIGYAYCFKTSMPRIVLVMALIGGASIAAVVRMPYENRMESSIGTMFGPSKMNMTKADKVASGRIALAVTAFKEFVSSPILGSGFSPYGRYEPVSPIIKMNSTSHIYYLTILWKGGLLFGLPFLTFLFFALRQSFVKSRLKDPEVALTLIGIALIFGPISFTYDTPNVPSAGALAFLLAGALCSRLNPPASADHGCDV